MGSLFANGRIVDCILGFMVIEAMVLILVRKRVGPRLQPLELLVNIGAGAALLLALRAALVGSPWPLIAAWLLFALGFHAAELALRWTAHRSG